MVVPENEPPAPVVKPDADVVVPIAPVVDFDDEEVEPETTPVVETTDSSTSLSEVLTTFNGYGIL